MAVGSGERVHLGCDCDGVAAGATPVVGRVGRGGKASGAMMWGGAGADAGAAAAFCCPQVKVGGGAGNVKVEVGEACCS